MYLVTMSCQSDDIPLRLFGSHRAAMEFVTDHDGEVPERILEMLSLDVTEWGLAIWEFDEGGELESREIPRWFEDEQREATQAASEN